MTDACRAVSGRARMTALLVLIAVVYGLIIGSFLNAWAWRLAHEESIWRGRSHCTQCGAQIRARDNVPVVSWLLLRGKCRDCGAPIHWRYPAGEALTGVLFGCVAAYDGLSWWLVPHLLFVSVDDPRQPGRPRDPDHPRRRSSCRRPPSACRS